MRLAACAFTRRAPSLASRAAAPGAHAALASPAAARAFATLTTEQPRAVSPSDVFVTQEVDMRSIRWFGMNYNHALCVWRPAALARIYALAAQHLVQQRHYPEAVLNLKYEPDFLVRGVSLDTHRGIVSKLTFLNAITPSAPSPPHLRASALGDVGVARGTAYFGRRCLTTPEVTRIYGGLRVSAPELRGFRHIVEPFSLVVASLVVDLCEAFVQSGASFHPSYVYQDVCAAVTHLGRGAFAAEVAAAPGAFVEEAPQLHAMLASLRANGRRLLLLTNSDFAFVDVGMRHMLRDQLPCPAEWPAMFDVVVVEAQRPAWFTEDAPFRSFNTNTRKVRWVPVRELRPGRVYSGGSFAELNRLVPGGMSGQDVLYLTSLSNPGARPGGDPWQDLSAPSSVGWRTGAVVAEVEREVAAQSHPRYRAALAALLDVERAVRLSAGPADAAALHAAQRGGGGDAATGVAGSNHAAADGGGGALLELRDELKHMLNPRFGSSFRTLTGPTLFAHNLLRFCDVYTARLENLLSLAPDHFLFPLRRALPHEPWGSTKEASGKTD